MKIGKYLSIGLMLLLTQALLTQKSDAANWQLETPWKNKMIYYIDVDSIKIDKKSEQIQFWLKAVSPFGYGTELILCNYKEKFFQILKYNDYDKMDNLLKTFTSEPDKAEKIKTTPDQVMFQIIESALSFKGSPTTAPSSDSSQKYEVLEGLKGVWIAAGNISDPKLERLGLTRERIINNVSTKLRQDRVKVLTKQEWQASDDLPFLYVKVDTATENDNCAFAVELKLLQKYKIEWAPRIIWTNATVWSSNKVGLYQNGNINKISASIDSLIDQFIKDFHLANLRKQG